MENEETKLLKVKDIQDLLKISRSQAYALTKLKDFPIIKIGKCIRVEKSLLLKWLHNN